MSDGTPITVHVVVHGRTLCDEFELKNWPFGPHRWATFAQWSELGVPDEDACGHCDKKADELEQKIAFMTSPDPVTS